MSSDRDWTTSEDGRANSSAEFIRLTDAVASLIQSEAHDLIGAHTKGVAAVILSHLAHVHGLEPNKRIGTDPRWRERSTAERRADVARCPRHHRWEEGRRMSALDTSDVRGAFFSLVYAFRDAELRGRKADDCVARLVEVERVSRIVEGDGLPADLVSRLARLVASLPHCRCGMLATSHGGRGLHNGPEVNVCDDHEPKGEPYHWAEAARGMLP